MQIGHFGEIREVEFPLYVMIMGKYGVLAVFELNRGSFASAISYKMTIF
jgi:hypothetical protein